MGRKAEGRVKPKPRKKPVKKPKTLEDFVRTLDPSLDLGLKLAAASVLATCIKYGPGFVIGVVSDTMRQMIALEPLVGHEECQKRYTQLHEILKKTEADVQAVLKDAKNHDLSVN
jgi:hypothetical protein